MRRHGKRVEPVTFTDPIIARADQLQTELEERPCRAVGMTDSVHTLIPDTALDQRWPRWSKQVAEWGWSRVLSFRLRTTQEVLGSLNIYGHASETFGSDEMDIADLFARHVSLTLAAHLELMTLNQAVRTRTVIGQAQGMLMERFGINGDQAVAVLRRFSQVHNKKLRRVAEDLVASLRLPQDPSEGEHS